MCLFAVCPIYIVHSSQSACPGGKRWGRYSPEEEESGLRLLKQQGTRCLMKAKVRVF